MADATESSTVTHSMGDLTFRIIELSTVADTNTHDSGISNVVGFWANGQASETAGQEGINVTESSGTFTFGLKTTGAVTLYVLSLDA